MPARYATFATRSIIDMERAWQKTRLRPLMEGAKIPCSSENPKLVSRLRY